MTTDAEQLGRETAERMGVEPHCDDGVWIWRLPTPLECYSGGHVSDAAAFATLGNRAIHYRAACGCDELAKRAHH